MSGSSSGMQDSSLGGSSRRGNGLGGNSGMGAGDSYETNSSGFGGLSDRYGARDEYGSGNQNSDSGFGSRRGQSPIT